jgi:23S rRNA pseudouridine1911/1915/1917 synthase
VQKAVRDLKYALVSLKIPGNAATLYAEKLAARGIGSAHQLAALSTAELDACKMTTGHRQLLKASALLLAADAMSDASAVDELQATMAAADPVVSASTTGRAVGTSDAVGAPPIAEGVGAVLEAEEAAQAEGVGAEDVINVVVSDEQAGSRLDAALAALLPPLSRSYFGALCGDGLVRLDGASAPPKKSAKVSAGDCLQVRLRAARELTVTPEPMELDVLYEDRHLIAISKPSGMVVHPAPGHWSGTFANGLAHHVQRQQAQEQEQQAQEQEQQAQEQEQQAQEREPPTPNGKGEGGAAASALPDAFGDGLRPGIVHRLDRFTTGVLLGAKTIDCQRALLDAFAGRRVTKVYLAVVAGMPKEAVTTIEAPIGRHPVDRVRMAVEPEGGRPSLSVVHRMASDGRLSLVAVRIGTGRTHQIRVHLQHLRCPVLGDSLYGDASRNKLEAKRASRPLLHAHTLSLEHPVLGGGSSSSPLRILAPPPADLRALAAELAGCGEDELDAWLAPRLEAALEGSHEMFEDLLQKYVA